MIEIDFSKGYKVTIDNYKKLRLASKQAYLTENFGLASSLNVLSTEELVKSLFIFIKQYNKDIGLKNFDKIFRSHKIKHSELENLIKSSYKGLENLSFNILHDKEDFIDRLPEERKEEYIKEYIDVERVQKRTNKIKKYQIPIEEIIEWLKNSNDIKNNGLYVDLIKNTGEWKSPSDFKKETIKSELKYSKVLKLCIENFMDIHLFMKELKEREKTNYFLETFYGEN